MIRANRGALAPAFVLLTFSLAAGKARAGDLSLEERLAEPPRERPAEPALRSDDMAERAVKLPNFLGLSGMRDMIDARIPEGLVIRAGARMEHESESLHGHLLEVSRDKIDLQGYAGIAALSLVEAGARVPFEIDHVSKGARSGGHQRRTTTTVGDVDVGAKIGIRFGPIALAPYAVATIPAGDRRFDGKAGIEIGGAASASLLSSRLVIHANVDGSFKEHELATLHWRFGVSVVPIAEKVFLVRPFVFLDGREFMQNGTGGELRAAAGVQAILFDFLTVEASGSWRFMDDANPTKVANDKGTFEFEAGVGVVF